MPLHNAQFASFGSHAPAKIVNNFDLEKSVETADEWIRTRTGMFERHHCTPEEAASDLAIVAATNAIESSKVRYRDIDLIVTATVTGDPVSYTHLRAHATPEHLVCRLLLEKKKTINII